MATNTPDGSSNEPKETFRVQRRRRTDPEPGGCVGPSPTRLRIGAPSALHTESLFGLIVGAVWGIGGHQYPVDRLCAAA